MAIVALLVIILGQSFLGRTRFGRFVTALGGIIVVLNTDALIPGTLFGVLTIGVFGNGPAFLSVAKRACDIFRRTDFQAKLMIAALRSNEQVTDLCGADLIMSIHPKYQKILLEKSVPLQRRIDEPISEETLAPLSSEKERLRFYRAYGLSLDELITCELTQRTLAPSGELGWKQRESFHASS